MLYTLCVILLPGLLFPWHAAAQINLSKAQFPYIISEHNYYYDTDEQAWFNPSPYASLLKEKHIRAVHVMATPAYSIYGQDFYFNKKGQLDSMVLAINDETESNSPFYSAYAFRYSNQGEISEILHYREGKLYGLMALVLNDNEDYKPDTAILSCLKYQHGAQVYLRNKAGLTLSQAEYIYDGKKPFSSYYKNDTAILSQTSFSWNDNNILTTATMAIFEPDPIMGSIYQCKFNEDNLPDSIIIKSPDNLSDTMRTYTFSYEYSNDIFRWSPCNYKGKRKIDDQIHTIEKLPLKKDSINNKNVQQVFRLGDYILKAVIGSDTCWFLNDELLLAKNTSESFYYLNDTLVSYSKTGTNPTETETTIQKRSDEKLKSVYAEIKKIQPLFGVRVTLLGKEPEFRGIKNDLLQYTLHIAEADLEKLKSLQTNRSDVSVTQYTFSTNNPGFDIMSWECKTSAIGEKEMNYMMNYNQWGQRFDNIVLTGSNGETRTLIGFRLIVDRK